MAKIRFRCNVSSDVFGEVEGKSLEACREMIRRIQLKLEEEWDRELDAEVSNGCVKDCDVSDVEEEILERNYKVKVTSVKYDIDDSEVDPLGNMSDEAIEEAKEELNATLPQEFEFEISCSEDDFYPEIDDKIYLETNRLVDKFDYEVVEEEK